MNFEFGRKQTFVLMCPWRIARSSFHFPRQTSSEQTHADKDTHKGKHELLKENKVRQECQWQSHTKRLC